MIISIRPRMPPLPHQRLIESSQLPKAAYNLKVFKRGPSNDQNRRYFPQYSSKVIFEPETYCKNISRVITMMTRSLKVNKSFPASLIFNLNQLIQWNICNILHWAPQKLRSIRTVLIEPIDLFSHSTSSFFYKIFLRSSL